MSGNSINGMVMKMGAMSVHNMFHDKEDTSADAASIGFIQLLVLTINLDNAGPMEDDVTVKCKYKHPIY